MREIFCREEADTICNLGICPGRQKDKLIWVGTKNGDFLFEMLTIWQKGMEKWKRGVA